MIRSKAYVSTEELGDQYCMIGPFKEQCARTEVEEAEFPSDSPLRKAVQSLRDQGYKVKYLFINKIINKNSLNVKLIIVNIIYVDLFLGDHWYMVS